jgi:hypothetical protein
MYEASGSKELEATLKQLRDKYGPEAFKQAYENLTRGKTGRPKVNNWDDLIPLLQPDIDQILGKLAGEPRSNNNIAKEIAASKANHSFESAHRRVMAELANHRIEYVKVIAAVSAATDAPWEQYIAQLARLSSGPRHTATWTTILLKANSVVAEFTREHGPPSIETTYAEILAHVQTSRRPRTAGFGLKGIIPNSR